MNWPLSGYIDGSSWSGVAAGLIFFIGILATIEGVLGGETLVNQTLVYVGGASLVVLGFTVGNSFLTSHRRASNSGGGNGKNPNQSTSQTVSDGSTAFLELYQSEGCPHCRKVRKFCTDYGISILLHNPRTAGLPFTSGSVRNERRYDELVEYGQDQIPLLVDNSRGEALYESDDIIEYLRNHYV